MKAYKLPDTLAPESQKCIKVYVPDDTEHLAVFWASYQFLTTWLAWERNEDHDAATVAAAWRACYDLAREQYENGEGCTGEGETLDFRDKPTDSGIVQYSTDGGETWIDGWHKCAPVVTIVRPSYDTSDEIAQLAADWLRFVFTAIIQAVLDEYDAEHDADTAAANVCDWLDTFGAEARPEDQIKAIWEELDSKTEGERLATVEDCYLVDYYPSFFDYVLANGNWLDQIMLWLYSLDTEITDDLLHALNAAVTLIGGQTAYNLYTEGLSGGGGGGGFGATCATWELFCGTSATEGYTAHWTPAVGNNPYWSPEATLSDAYASRIYFTGLNQSHVAIVSEKPQSATHYTNVEVRLANGAAGNVVCYAALWGKNDELIATLTVGTYSPGITTHNVNCSYDAYHISIYCSVAGNYYEGFEHVKLTGTGMDPWS